MTIGPSAYVCFFCLLVCACARVCVSAGNCVAVLLLLLLGLLITDVSRTIFIAFYTVLWQCHATVPL